MKHMQGNLRPPAPMSRDSSIMLPSARIRCDSGRIHVGNRSFLSASDALSAYMQQFDWKQQNSTGSSGPARNNTSLDAVIQKSALSGVSSASHRKSDPANVTGLLTGSPRSAADMNGMSVNSMSLAGSSSRLLNGEGRTLQSSKHSVSFALPDSPRSSQQHSRNSASFAAADSARSQSSPHRHSGYGVHQHRPPHSYSTTQHTSSDVSGLSRLSLTDASLPLHAATTTTTTTTTTTSSDIYGKSLSQSNGLVESGLSKSSGLLQNGEDTGCADVTDTGGGSGSSGVPRVGGQQRAKSEVEVLLSVVPLQRELRIMSEDALREVKLKRLLTEASTPQSSSNSSNKSSLQLEVEEALSRSAQLLENIKTDALVSPRCVSDVGSLNTDILLSVNPYNPADAINKIASSRESRSRHRYSYHTPGHHARSLSVGRVPSTAEQHSLRDTGRRRSVDSLGPLFPGEKGFQDLNSSMSVLSDSEDILKQLRAANASSASGSAQHQTMDANPRATSHTGPPSWIQELIPPSPAEKPNGTSSAALVDSIFSERGASGGRPAPSWVNGLEQSDIASSVDTHDLRDAADSLTLAGARKAPGCETTDRADDSSITDLSYAGPGLNFSDLITSPASGRHKVSFSDQLHHHPKPPGKVSRNNSFSGVGSSFRNSFSCRKDVDRSKPPVTISRIHQDLAGVETTRPKSYQTPTSLSSSVGADSSASILRKKVSEDSVYAKRSMDTYLSRLKSGSVESGDVVGKTDRETARIPRCSSVDTLYKVDGQGGMSSDITGASPITRDSNLSSKLCLDDPTLTPAGQRRGLGPAAWGGAGHSPDTDQDLLDGDRPWESMLPSFKAPVHVGGSSQDKAQAVSNRPETPTLSGGQQPGSMEALKQMLFRLQDEETATALPSMSAAGALEEENDEASKLIPALKDYDFEVEPGGQSLERALVHLGRLKTLVQTGTAGPQTSSQHQEQTT